MDTSNEGKGGWKANEPDVEGQGARLANCLRLGKFLSCSSRKRGLTRVGETFERCSRMHGLCPRHAGRRIIAPIEFKST